MVVHRIVFWTVFFPLVLILSRYVSMLFALLLGLFGVCYYVEIYILGIHRRYLELYDHVTKVGSTATEVHIAMKDLKHLPKSAEQMDKRIKNISWLTGKIHWNTETLRSQESAPSVTSDLE